MAIPDLSADWEAIRALPRHRLTDLFETDPGRAAELTRSVAGITFDWSKTHLDKPLVAAFEKLAADAGYDRRRSALFAGEVVNPSEDRPATHVAERGQGAAADVDLAPRRHQRVRFGQRG